MSTIIELFIFFYLAAIVLVVILSAIWFTSMLFDLVSATRKQLSARLPGHSNNWVAVFAKPFTLPCFMVHPVALTLLNENQNVTLKWRGFNSSE